MFNSILRRVSCRKVYRALVSLHQRIFNISVTAMPLIGRGIEELHPTYSISIVPGGLLVTVLR